MRLNAEVFIPGKPLNVSTGAANGEIRSSVSRRCRRAGSQRSETGFGGLLAVTLRPLLWR